MQHTFQKMVVKETTFYFIASPTFIFILYLLFGFGFLGGAAKIASSYGINHWFYTCLVLGLIGLVVSPSAFKSEYGFEWGGDEKGLKVATRFGKKVNFYEWGLVKEILLIDYYRTFESENGSRGVGHFSKAVFFMIDQSTTSKNLIERFAESQKSIRLVEEGYIMMQYCGSAQEQVLEQLKKYAPSHVRIVAHDKVDDVRDAANELKESWKRNI